MNIFKSKLKLVKGTRFVSFLFIGSSVLIAAGVLIAANIYYNIDTGEVVTEEIQRVTGTLRATARLIVGGTATQDPAAGIGLEIASNDVLLSAANQLLRFTGGTGNYVGFRAPTTLTTTTIYTWPAAYPASTGYVLQSTVGGVLSWLDLAAAGLGDVIAVGDCPSGECFTADGVGNILWFEGATADAHEIILTAADSGADHTITLPAATGMVALGTGAAGHVAYWTALNTLAGEPHLSTIRGGTGANSAAWNGMVRVVGGTWGPITGTPGHAAFWSDANTVGGEPHLGVARGGTGRGTWTPWGVLFASAPGTLDNTGAGSTRQILTANTGAAPTWRNIAELVTATNGLTMTGTDTIALRLGGALTGHTTIDQGLFNMIFNLTGAGDFKVRDAGTDLFTVTDDGRILFRTYPLAESGKQILREMIPIFGFDLPSQTAATSYIRISRTLENYPFSAPATGTTRVHKFVIRYADATTTAPSNWRVFNETGNAAIASFQVPASASTDLNKGEVRITDNVIIPTNTDDWRLDIRTPGTTVRVYQIFLAAYDQIL